MKYRIANLSKIKFSLFNKKKSEEIPVLYGPEGTSYIREMGGDAQALFEACYKADKARGRR